MNRLNQIACFFVLIVAVTGTAFGQHASSAKQTITFGVVRSPRVLHSDIASTGNRSLAYVVSSTRNSQVISGETVGKITFSAKPQPKLSEESSYRIDGISVGASISSAGGSQKDIEDAQMDMRTMVQSGGSLPLNTEPLVITITD